LRAQDRWGMLDGRIEMEGFRGRSDILNRFSARSARRSSTTAGPRLAIVGIDALFIRRQTVPSIRGAIQKQCGIPPQSVLISASHTHSGGPIGYVPTEEALGARGGGYETRLTSYSNREPAAGRMIADALIELSGTLKPGRVPRPPCPAAVSRSALVLR
jgi:hypothetical protein